MLIQRRALIRVNTVSSFALIGCFDVSDFSLRRLNTSLLTSIIFRDGRYYKPYFLTNTYHIYLVTLKRLKCSEVDGE